MFILNTGADDSFKLFYTISGITSCASKSDYLLIGGFITHLYDKYGRHGAHGWHYSLDKFTKCSMKSVDLFIKEYNKYIDE